LPQKPRGPVVRLLLRSSCQYEIDRFRERARVVGDTLSGVARVRRLTSVASVLWIDFDYSSFVAAHALGADYRDLGNEGTPALCPLERAGISDEEDQFLLAFADRLFAHWQTAFKAEDHEEFAHSIAHCASEGLRRMWHLAGMVQVLALRRILTQYTALGPWGQIFDGEPDNLGRAACARFVSWLIKGQS
jgi:type IV secretory pathway VirB4 component